MPSANAEDIAKVWHAWLAKQLNPRLCTFTEDRRELIASRLKLGYTADDLIWLVRYAFESDDDLPQFWRGKNDRRQKYTDLLNLLRKEKLGGRVQSAKEWAQEEGLLATGETQEQPSLLAKPEPAPRPVSHAIPRGRSLRRPDGTKLS